MKYLAACLLLSTATALSQPATEIREMQNKLFDRTMGYYGDAKYAEGHSAMMLLAAPKRIMSSKSDKTEALEALEELLARAKDHATKGMNVVEHLIDNPGIDLADRITTKHISKLALEGSRSYTRAAKNYEQTIEITRNYHR